MTIEKVRELVKENCEIANVELIVPVEANGRLTSTLGRVKYKKCGEESIPTIIEFSKQLLNTATDKSIIDVVKHETAHYIATMRTKKVHGHDFYFKNICHELGTDNDKTSTAVERTVSAKEIYKYFVRCPHCGYNVGYSKAGKCVKHPDWFNCGKCHSAGLEVIVNW